MAKRRKIEKRGLYFDPERSVQMFPSGCVLLDCILGGGWAEGRMANIIGDTSVGKTQLAIEAAANFIRKYPDGLVRYAETEAAFDEDYAQAVGLPMHAVEFASRPVKEEAEEPEEDDEQPKRRKRKPKDTGKRRPIETVEDLEVDVKETAARIRKDQRHCLYVTDSWDALTDSVEKASNPDDASYGMAKARGASRLFRVLVRDIERDKLMTWIVISQIRDKPKATPFDKGTRRSGGRALDFYASQIIELAHLKRLSKERKGVKRAVGIVVRAASGKSKVGPPFRAVQFPIMFNYGMEEVVAGVQWLIEVKRTNGLFDSAKDAKTFCAGLDRLSPEEYAEERANVVAEVRKVWREIETEFQPPRRKYQ